MVRAASPRATLALAEPQSGAGPRQRRLAQPKLKLSGRQRARYRIEWDDGRTSSYTPATGALQLAPETAKRAG